MTYEQFAIKYLTSNGMNAKQAAEVMKMAKQNLELQPMKDEWDNPAGDFTVETLLKMHMNIVALQWTIANEPLAWFRTMFEN